MRIAGVVKSIERFESFARKFSTYGYQVRVIDFEDTSWVNQDFGDLDCLVYYPSFQYTSNYPLALRYVTDNLREIHRRWPDLAIFPDPNLFAYYNDKFAQHLFLSHEGFPTPKTMHLEGESSIAAIESRIGYPVVVKNRLGAGGEQVNRINSPKELYPLYEASEFRFGSLAGWKWIWQTIMRRPTLRALSPNRAMTYPFLSPPLLVQEFVEHDRDLKVVVIDGVAVESHWRLKAERKMWKVNIDGGGIGQWSHVPDEPLRVSERLARALNARWLNIDLLEGPNGWLVSEFSPVWHHYGYKEKASFLYKDDYNLPIPADVVADLEELIVSSLAGGRSILASSGQMGLKAPSV